MRFLLLVVYVIFFSSSIAYTIEDSPICINRSNKVVAVFEDEKTIHIQFSPSLRNTTLSAVYGVDGLKVFSYEFKETEKFNDYKLIVNFDRPTGLSYLVINVEYDEFIGGVRRARKEVISLKVGELSVAQKNSRLRNIKSYKLRGNNGNGLLNSGNVEVEVQELPLKRID